MVFSISKGLVLVSVLASQAHAFWRLPCSHPVTAERIDPIVSPGKVAGHAHSIMGASGISERSTFKDLVDSECTSCLVVEDKSAYWVPQIYFQFANGSFTPVRNTGALIYYLPRFHSSDKGPIEAFPDGFQVLVGDPMLRSKEDTEPFKNNAINWNCLGANAQDPSGQGKTVFPNIPSYNCPGGLRQEIRFPSCWDGKNLDSPDHFAHVSYGGGESGPCPATHPRRLVTIFYEFFWDVDAFNGMRNLAKNPKQPFVLAQGDPTGYGNHADFQNGWDHDVLQRAIETCTSDSGVIEYCKAFTLQKDNCRKTPSVDEAVLVPRAQLPGCNPVVDGPGRAGMCADTNPPKILNNFLQFVGSSPPPGSVVPDGTLHVVMNYKDWEYDSCYSDSNGRSLPSRVQTTSNTVEACLDACAAAGFTFCGLEYFGQECWGSRTAPAASRQIDYKNCDHACKGNPSQICGGSVAGPALTGYKLVAGSGANRPSITTTQGAATTTAQTTTTEEAATTTEAENTTEAETTTEAEGTDTVTRIATTTRNAAVTGGARTRTVTVTEDVIVTATC